MLFLGERYDAPALLELGVAWRVVPDEELLGRPRGGRSARPPAVVGGVGNEAGAQPDGLHRPVPALRLETEATVAGFLDPEDHPVAQRLRLTDASARATQRARVEARPEQTGGLGQPGAFDLRRVTPFAFIASSGAMPSSNAASTNIVSSASPAMNSPRLLTVADHLAQHRPPTPIHAIALGCRRPDRATPARTAPSTDAQS